MSKERVQKILSNAGYGSRRSCEDLILAGRVTVNGKMVNLGEKADPNKDQIRLDGRLIEIIKTHTYIALYKPRGVLSSTKSEHQRKTVLDFVPNKERLFPVGRLDIDSEGLILLTNDGDLANKLTHPRYGHEKEYRVLVARRPDPEQLKAWGRGVVLVDGYRTKSVNVSIEKFHGKGAWLNIIMTEGRKRQIREISRQLGLPVVKLIRTRINTLRLGNLKPGQYRELNTSEIAQLKK